MTDYTLPGKVQFSGLTTTNIIHAKTKQNKNKTQTTKFRTGSIKFEKNRVGLFENQNLFCEQVLTLFLGVL